MAVTMAWLIVWTGLSTPNTDLVYLPLFSIRNAHDRRTLKAAKGAGLAQGGGGAHRHVPATADCDAYHFHRGRGNRLHGAHWRVLGGMVKRVLPRRDGITIN